MSLGQFFCCHKIKLVCIHVVLCYSVLYLETLHGLQYINPLVMNGLSHPYQLDESTFISWASGVIFHFYFISR